MSVIRDGTAVRLVGDCGVEDAEPLLAFCAASPRAPVDLSGAGPLHTAVVQVLLAFRPPIRGPVADAFTARWIVPALAPGAV